MTAKSEIADRLRATLAKELKQDIDAITPQHTLRDDLGLNSLDAIELMFKIEEEFDLSIPDEDMQRLVTVGDVVVYLEGRLKGGVPATPSPSVPRAESVSTSKASAVPSSGKSIGRGRPPATGKSGSARKPAKPTRPSGSTTKAKGSRRHA